MNANHKGVIRVSSAGRAANIQLSMNWGPCLRTRGAREIGAGFHFECTAAYHHVLGRPAREYSYGIEGEEGSA